MPLLARWLRRAMANQVRFWSLIVGLVVVVTGLAPSCSDHQTDSGHPAETVDSVEATSAAYRAERASTSEVTCTTITSIVSAMAPRWPP